MCSLNQDLHLGKGRERKPALLVLLVLSLMLGACSGLPESGPVDGAPGRQLNPDGIADAVPRMEARSRYGNPASYVVRGKRYQVMANSSGYRTRGIASWYGTKFHGRRTSSGETYDMYLMTAAHKSLPLPTYVRVRNLSNGRSAIVKVNDRGPFHDNRIIDLSYAAATKLGILAKGTGLVEIEAIDPRRPESAPPETIAKQPTATGTEAGPPEVFVQTGAFSNRFNADRERQRIATSLRRPVRVLSASLAGKPVYRVQIGPLASVEQVDAISVKLAQIGIPNPHVVIE